MPKLTLYTYWRSSASFRVRLALAFKGLAYEAIPVNLLAGEQQDETYRRMNPMGYLPCLVLDGEPFVESTAILELLEELFPEPALLPADPRARAHVRALMQIVNSGIQPLQNLTVLDRVGDDADARKAWMLHFITRGLEAWERLAASAKVGGPFAYGPRFTMADVLVLPQIYSARRVGIDVDRFAILRRVERETADLPFVRAAHPEAQPDAER